VELQGGAGKAGLLGGKVPSAEDIRDWNFSVIAAGGKGVLYWQYAAEPAGTESPGFGLVHFDGSDTPRSLSAGACAKRFDVEWLDGARRVSPVNAIYLSRNSALFCYAMGDEEKYNRSFRGVYRALYDAGVPVRFVHGDTAANLYAQGVRNLYVPMGLCLDDAERAALAAFARDGGRLIVEGGFGLYRENGQLDMDASLMNEIFGMAGVAVEPVSGACAELEGGGAFVCDAYRQTYHSCGEGCRVLARFEDGRAAALRAGFGRGEVIWISGFAGLAYSLNPDEKSGAFISSLFDAHGYAQVERLEANGMVVRLLENEGEILAVCANHGDREKTLELKLCGGEGVRANIPPHDGAILRFPKT
jgi:beta-galactosidase